MRQERDDGRRRAPQCHCQGGRLIIIIGRGSNDAIRAALDWAATTSLAHLHKVHFDERIDANPDLVRPRVSPGAAGKVWPDFQKGSQTGAIGNMVQTFDDCCYYEEVMIVAHGSQVSLYRELASFLPRFLDRPVKKLVFWVCGANRESFPFTNVDRLRYFKNICHLVRPPTACPCGCDHAKCHAHSADGAATQCPDPGTPTVVLSAGYFTVHNRTVPSKLGIDPANPGEPFTAPDARLIETTVSRDGTGARIEPRAVTGASVFGTTVHNDETLKQNPPALGFDPVAKITPANVPDTGATLAPYRGPRRDATRCPAADGCLT